MSRTVTAGASVTFSVTAAGTTPLSYQWQKDSANISGATSATLTLSSVTSAQAGSYRVIVSNTAGSVTSAAATLAVNAAVVAPSITQQPVSRTATAGASVSFSVTATGTAPLSYQWQKDSANISGATSATLTLSSVTSAQAGSYRVIVSNTAGSVTSAAATLTVNAAVVAPSITQQPVSRTVTAGASASFSVTASGTAPLSYQWQKDGANVAGATSATLTLASVTSAQAGSYRVIVSNTAGSVTSAAATLTVNAAVVAPSITQQPVSRTVTAGANVSFSVTATGTAPLSYQWQRNGANVAGATSATLTLANVTTAQAGSYQVTVRNSAGSALSAVVTLTVNPAVTVPVVTVVGVETNASEVGPKAGKLQVTRTGSTSNPLTVSYTLGGTAQNGIDYQRLPGSVVIPAGAASADILVTPIEDTTTTAESRETVILQVVASATTPAAYTVGSPNMASVVIESVSTPSDNVAPVVHLLQPEDGKRFAAGRRIVFVAHASDADGQVARVEFFAGNTSLGIGQVVRVGDDDDEDREEDGRDEEDEDRDEDGDREDDDDEDRDEDRPRYVYVLTWNRPVAGTHIITVRATDNEGATSISEPTQIRVQSWRR